MKYNALILGCGNIGASYDLNDEHRVWSHAKAFSKTRAIRFSVADTDAGKAESIARAYKVPVFEAGDDSDFRQFDIVVIATPTPTHAKWIRRLVEQKIPLIICEKPVASTQQELNALSNMYKKGQTKILVNYIRRFQPAYGQLKRYIGKLSARSDCKGINIKYQRGFVNNGSHAFDLLEFLFDKPFLMKGFHIEKAAFDAFGYDPTISGTCSFNKYPVTILGLENISYPVFEIEIFFSSQKIVICHSGDEIRVYTKKENSTATMEVQELRQTAILDRYMLPVVAHALKMVVNKKDIPDNFLQAVRLNKELLKIVSTINKK